MVTIVAPICFIYVTDFLFGRSERLNFQLSCTGPIFTQKLHFLKMPSFFLEVESWPKCPQLAIYSSRQSSTSQCANINLQLKLLDLIFWPEAYQAIQLTENASHQKISQALKASGKASTWLPLEARKAEHVTPERFKIANDTIKPSYIKFSN